MRLPTLLLTRPRAQSERFSDALAPDARARVRIVISALIDIAATGADATLPPEAGVIFTSANGVLCASAGDGRRAFCVGAGTTRAAQDRGWRARQVGETAAELIATLCASPPDTALVHLAGAHTRGRVAETLSAAGIPTTRITVYTQNLRPLSAEARSALGASCIVPLFSPRTAAQFVVEADRQLGTCHLIALSPAVAEAVPAESVASLAVLPKPQAALMRRAVENACRVTTLT